MGMGGRNTLDERMMLLRNLELFFTAHADQPVASQNLTAAQAATLHNNLAAARNAVNGSLADTGEKKEARDKAEEMLVKAMRGLIKELSHLLGDDDPRWRRFGLKRPADPELAEVVSGVVVEGPGQAICSCDGAAVLALSATACASRSSERMLTLWMAPR
jgi:hypothetical protein